MKNAILMVAAMGMFGGAFAASSVGGTATTPATTTVIQPVSATVTNVCTYAVDSQENVNGRTFTQDNKNLGSYNALGATSASVPMGQFYIFRCTTGTSWDSLAYAKTGEITLTGMGGTLMASYIVNVNDVSTGDGDIHSAGVDFKIPKGQWTSKAGSYSGNLTVVISYN